MELNNLSRFKKSHWPNSSQWFSIVEIELFKARGFFQLDMKTGKCLLTYNIGWGGGGGVDSFNPNT